ncbi:hypothetical protein [Halobacteriovorax sp. HLS]|uniref:hypothetical protein n=1 Tax=Halobacteriovorax sp. HLS TaxID=2234000 RepID=UPI000FDB0269|nr:hypothetical protein [Halobacteriovorax sp. HLS]
MQKLNSQLLLLTMLFLIMGCVEEPIETFSNFVVQPGDVVVTNITNDSVVLLDSTGNFKRVLYDVQNNVEVPYGVGWKADTLEVLVAVDGADRVMAISAVDGSARALIQTPFLSGSIRGVAQLTDGSIIVAESNGVEKFDTNGNRITTGFPLTGGINNVENVYPKADGGFIVCARGGDVVRTYTAAGVLQNSTASGIGGTTDGYGCTELSDGTIATSWSGSTDTVSIYNSSLSSASATYNDTTTVPSPRGVAQLANGNLIVADATYHHIIEINPADGSFVGTFSSYGLSSPNQIYVIPNFL